MQSRMNRLALVVWLVLAAMALPACSGPSAREQALEATVVAMQTQIARVGAPASAPAATPTAIPAAAATPSPDSTSAPTATTAPPTATPAPPTATAAPATQPPVPPAATAVPLTATPTGGILSPDAKALVTAYPSTFSQQELGDAKYVEALNVVAASGCTVARANPVTCDGLAEAVWSWKMFCGPDGKLTIDNASGVHIPALVKTRVEAIVGNKTILDPKKPGWTLAVPGGYNKGVAEQITTGTDKAQALFSSVAFPMTWWRVAAPDAAHPYLQIPLKDIDGGADGFVAGPVTTTPIRVGLPVMYRNFMSMAADTSSAERFGSILTDRAKLETMLSCLAGDMRCFDNQAYYNVWHHSLAINVEIEVPKGSAWVDAFARLPLPGASGVTNYDRLVAAVSAAARDYQPEEEGKSRWGRDVSYAGQEQIGYYRAFDSSARLAGLGIPPGGFAWLIPASNGGSVGGNATIELAPIPSDAFAETLATVMREKAALPLQTAFNGLTLEMPYSLNWLAEKRLMNSFISLYGNLQEPNDNTSAFAGIFIVRTYEKKQTP